MRSASAEEHAAREEAVAGEREYRKQRDADRAEENRRTDERLDRATAAVQQVGQAASTPAAPSIPQSASVPTARHGSHHAATPAASQSPKTATTSKSAAAAPVKGTASSSDVTPAVAIAPTSSPAEKPAKAAACRYVHHECLEVIDREPFCGTPDGRRVHFRNKCNYEVHFEVCFPQPNGGKSNCLAFELNPGETSNSGTFSCHTCGGRFTFAAVPNELSGDCGSPMNKALEAITCDSATQDPQTARSVPAFVGEQ
jgi:hypothetical protein